MGVKYFCDGLETPVEDESDLKEILGRHYSAEAVPMIEAYLSARDELHDAVQKQWNDGLKKLRNEYHKELPGKLPDE